MPTAPQEQPFAFRGCLAEKHDANYIFQFVDKAIRNTCPENVVQIVTDKYIKHGGPKYYANEEA